MIASDQLCDGALAFVSLPFHDKASYLSRRKDWERVIDRIDVHRKYERPVSISKLIAHYCNHRHILNINDCRIDRTVREVETVINAGSTGEDRTIQS